MKVFISRTYSLNSRVLLPIIALIFNTSCSSNNIKKTFWETTAEGVATTLSYATFALMVPIDIIGHTAVGKKPMIFKSEKERLQEIKERDERYKKNAQIMFEYFEEQLNKHGKDKTFIIDSPSFLKDEIINFIHTELYGAIVKRRSRIDSPNYKFIAYIDTKESPSYGRLKLKITSLDTGEILFFINFNAYLGKQEKQAYSKEMHEALHRMVKIIK